MSKKKENAQADKSKKRSGAAASSSEASSEDPLKKKFKTRADVELALANVEKQSKERGEELKILRARLQKNALNEWSENWTCSICLDPSIIPIKICKAQSKHVTCLSCAVTLSSSCFFVPDSSLADPSQLKLSYHFDGSTDEKKLMACCPQCRNPSPVLKVEDFVLGRMFTVFPETVYAQIRELAKDSKANVFSSVELKCCWDGCDTLTVTTADLIRHVFECKRRLFQCPIGRNPFQSHRPRDIECKEQFSRRQVVQVRPVRPVAPARQDPPELR